MTTMDLSTRRPILFTTSLGRKPKLPDSQSMVFAQVQNKLYQANYNLSVERCRSQDKTSEIEDLRAQITRLTREKQDAIEDCVNAKLEALRLSRSNERLQSQVLKTKGEKDQMTHHIAKLEFENRLMRHEHSAKVRCTKLFNQSSWNNNVRDERNLQERLRMATVLLGVLQCELDGYCSNVKEIGELLGQLARMKAVAQKISQENNQLRMQQEVDDANLFESVKKERELECKLGKSRNEVKKLSEELSEQRYVNKRMESMLKKFEENRLQDKNHVEGILNELKLRSEQAEMLGERVQKLGRSNEQLKKEQKKSDDLLREFTSLVDTLKSNQAFSRKVEMKVGELLSGVRLLQDAYKEVMVRSAESSSQSKDKNQEIETRAKMQTAIEARRSIFNQIQEIRGNVRVFCRVRPSKKHNQAPPFINIPHASAGNNWTMVCRDELFSFDRVFQQSASNKEVYAETAGVVESVLGGSNVCILAYGQTGSGKSYTMEGVREDPGVNFLALQHLFKLLSEQNEFPTKSVSVSVIEVYNDEIQDLLVNSNGDGCVASGKDTGNGNRRCIVKDMKRTSQKLQVRKVSPNSNQVHVPGVVKMRVSNVADVKRVLGQAKRRRSVSSTMMNSESSRSHLVVEVEVKGREGTAKLHLVDLAGSERVDRSKVKGARLKETIHINKSLATLGNVFSALENRRAHIPYRDTKLTHLLSNSIGGDAKTLMFITVSGDQQDKAETCATLKFGKRVSKIMLREEESNKKVEKLRELEKSLREVETIIEETKQNLDR